MYVLYMYIIHITCISHIYTCIVLYNLLLLFWFGVYIFVDKTKMKSQVDDLYHAVHT